MSLLLHLETATTVCSVALSFEGKLIALKEENKGYTHAEHLTFFIEEVMQMAGKSFEQLDAVTVSKGPGSYTGLRIGVATAKGLCVGLNKPLIAVNTLNSMAQGAQQKHGEIYHFCPMIDARRMEVYTSLFNQSGEELQATEALILSENTLEKSLDEFEILFFGDGALKFQAICQHKNAKFDLDFLPSAAHMIDLSYARYLNKEFEDVAYFEPFYLKEFYTTSAKVKQ